jgi:WD40 repeat protein/serine/threonine protein kinase
MELMGEETSVNDLVTRWHQLHQQGQAPSVEDLCAGCPDRLEELKRHLREVASMQEFLRLSQGGGTAGGPRLGGAEQTLSQNGGPLPLPAAGQSGGLIAGYEILGELGRGGMGVVYKARQVGLKRLVALKMVLAGSHAGPDRVARFRTEAEAVARLQHPNIVQVYETGTHEGSPFFSMEYVEGTSLAQHLAGNLLQPREAAALVAPLADAIHFAHQQGIIHRDLKPANVLLAGAGRPSPGAGKGNGAAPSTVVPGRPSQAAFTPKITDFGLAKQLQDDSGLTQTGAILGTPSYMAPEQANGMQAAVGPATDVYGLGGILYETLTGRPPFRGATQMDTLYQVRQEEPVPPRRFQPRIPRDLEVICLKCLQKEPARRYPSAGDLADDLRRFQAGEPVAARAAGRLERGWRWCRRNPVVAGLLATVAVVLLAGMAGVLHFAIRANANARTANRARVAAEEAGGKEAAARRQAQKNARHARESARQAQQSAARLHRGLIRRHVAAGTYFLETGDRAQGLWRYAHAWKLDAADPATQDSHRLRLGFTLQAGPQLVGVCFHRRSVRDAVFDPNGKRVLTRTDERRVYLWDPFTSRLATPPLVHQAEVRTATFSPDGKQVATGSTDGRVRLWEARSGKLLRTLPAGAAVNALAYRRTGNMLAVATAACAVLFRDARTGRTAAPTVRLKAAVYHVAFSPHGRRVVTADAGHVARVWEVASGKPLTAPLPHRDHRAQNEVAITYRCWPVFSPDGRSLVTVHPKKVATVWDLATGKPRYPPLTKHGWELHQVRFSNDGSLLLTQPGDTVRIYQAATGRWLRDLRHPRESPHSCFRPDGKVLATCSTGGLIHLWDPATGKETGQALRCGDGVQALTFSPDGRHLLAASHDGTARVWRLTPATRLRPYRHDCGRAHLLPFRSGAELVRYSPDGRRMVWYGGPAGARLRDRGGRRSEILLKHPGPVILTRFSGDGRRLLTLDRKGRLRWWDTASGRRAARSLTRSALLDVDLSGDGRRLLTVERGPAGPAERVVTVWDVDRRRRLLGPLRRWDTGQQRFGYRAWHRRISQAALSPDGTRLVLASDATGVLGVWDVDAGQELVKKRGYRGMLYGIEFSRDGRRFLTFGSDTVARLWHTATLKPAGPPLRHPRFCKWAAVGPDGWRVATAGSDHVVRLWDGRTGDLLGRLELTLKDYRLWFSQDGRRLVLDGGSRVLDLPVFGGTPKQLPALLLRLLTGLDRDEGDSIVPVDPQTFRSDPNRYRRAWHAWRGQADDPTNMP